MPKSVFSLINLGMQQTNIIHSLPINKVFETKINLIRRNTKIIAPEKEKSIDIELYKLISKFALDDASLTHHIRMELYVKILDMFGADWISMPKGIISKTIREISKLILEKYIEPKQEYAKCFSRTYGNLIIKDWIRELLNVEGQGEILISSKSAVKIFMDMNGLGKLNMIGKPFHTVSKAIGTFVNMLKNSQTLNQLKLLGLECKLNVDGGDEFSLFIYDPNYQINVYALMPEIKYSLLLEMESTVINNFLDQTKLDYFFGADKTPQINLSSSIGYVSFWQLVNGLTLEEIKNRNSDQFLDFICLRWFDLAYSDASKFKIEYKELKIRENPKLYNFLFSK